MRTDQPSASSDSVSSNPRQEFSQVIETSDKLTQNRTVCQFWRSRRQPGSVQTISFTLRLSRTDTQTAVDTLTFTNDTKEVQWYCTINTERRLLPPATTIKTIQPSNSHCFSNGDSSQKASLSNGDSSQKASLSNGDSSQKASLSNDDSSQKDSLSNGDSSQKDSLSNYDSSQKASLTNDDSSQKDSLSIGDSSQK
ncbi:hypothetical protein BaRGS_00010315 [Batillaria attramentaria]|uniref:Uncharacterized protein n=1 Tax=Batillaria attramentaria TaxID=370345 RepID=A0ABD0LGM5_9CAEN